MRVCIFVDRRHPRARRIGEALDSGARRIGWQTFVAHEPHAPRADLIVGYGWKHKPIFDAYRAAGAHFLYVDLGYWHRKTYASDYDGLHKVVLDDRHATAYFQRRRPADRLTGAPELEPWREDGRHIVLAGLSAKSARGSGLEPLAWEMAMLARLRSLTDRPIIYRPKPSWAEARPIDGTIFSPPEQPLREVLIGAQLLVTLHSNAALDALAAGVPAHAEEGLASVVSTPLESVDDPARDCDRAQWMADVGYCQWSRKEIAAGTAFQQFLDDGLIC